MADTLLHRLFREMLRIRVIERRIAERYSEQEMRCPVHLSIGQEAVAVGVCAHLETADKAMSAHRSHGHYLAKGGDVRAMIAELYGRADGCCGGRGGSMHLIDRAAGFWGAVPIVGSTLPIALGLALAARQSGSTEKTVAFLGEGATEEGVFTETLNLACVLRLIRAFCAQDAAAGFTLPSYSLYPVLVEIQDGRSNVIEFDRSMRQIGRAHV